MQEEMPARSNNDGEQFHAEKHIFPAVEAIRMESMVIIESTK